MSEPPRMYFGLGVDRVGSTLEWILGSISVVPSLVACLVVTILDLSLLTFSLTFPFNLSPFASIQTGSIEKKFLKANLPRVALLSGRYLSDFFELKWVDEHLVEMVAEVYGMLLVGLLTGGSLLRLVGDIASTPTKQTFISKILLRAPAGTVDLSEVNLAKEVPVLTRRRIASTPLKSLMNFAITEEFPIHRVLPNNDWEENCITFRSKMDKLFESYQRKDKGPEEHWITFRSKMNKLFESHWRKDKKVIKYLARQVQRFKRLMKVAIQQQTGVVEENGN
ncbi:hypothetical protein CPC08DRAFT_728644 [Agrocybe pediades]|nr:hypothetical protein CPC08DRAFT_728644 [Agrocybe pediades]